MKSWTPSEDVALRAVYELWGSDWKRHIFGTDDLGNRSLSQCANRLRKMNGLEKGTGIEIPNPISSKVERIPWPEPGIILFRDDPRAGRDHGSLGQISRAVLYSASGCSARWASEAA